MAWSMGQSSSKAVMTMTIMSGSSSAWTFSTRALPSMSGMRRSVIMRVKDFSWMALMASSGPGTAVTS